MYIRPKLKPANLKHTWHCLLHNEQRLTQRNAFWLTAAQKNCVVLVQVPPKQPKQIMGNMQYLVSHVTSTTVLQKAGGTIMFIEINSHIINSVNAAWVHTVTLPLRFNSLVLNYSSVCVLIGSLASAQLFTILRSIVNV